MRLATSRPITLPPAPHREAIVTIGARPLSLTEHPVR
jgi:hypothetical protein